MNDENSSDNQTNIIDDEWKLIKIDVKRKERIYITSIIFVALAGITGSVLAEILKNSLNIIDCEAVCFDSSTSMGILSIQATVSTFIITIISLMTGKVEHTFLGISINDFLMNIKPVFFKQKDIILSDLLLLTFGIAFHILKAYLIVISYFVISLILISISVHEIYEAFMGTEDIELEIKSYMLDGTGKEYDE